jgi:hypothetical protein
LLKLTGVPSALHQPEDAEKAPQMSLLIDNQGYLTPDPNYSVFFGLTDGVLSIPYPSSSFGVSTIDQVATLASKSLVRYQSQRRSRTASSLAS